MAKKIKRKISGKNPGNGFLGAGAENGGTGLLG